MIEATPSKAAQFYRQDATEKLRRRARGRWRRFAVGRGSITALIGPNGAGKTTLFDPGHRLWGAGSGAVQFEGRDISGLPPHRIARLGLVRTFQLTRVFAAMTVLENMMLAGPRQPGEALVG